MEKLCWGGVIPTWPTSVASSSWCKRDESCQLRALLPLPPTPRPVYLVGWKWKTKTPNRCGPINIGRVTVCIGCRAKVLIQLFANVRAQFLCCFNLHVMKTTPPPPIASSYLIIFMHSHTGCLLLYNAVRSRCVVEWTKEQEQCNTLQNMASELNRSLSGVHSGLNVRKPLPHVLNFTGVYVDDCNPSMRTLHC